MGNGQDLRTKMLTFVVNLHLTFFLLKLGETTERTLDQQSLVGNLFAVLCCYDEPPGFTYSSLLFSLANLNLTNNLLLEPSSRYRNLLETQ